MPFKLDDGLIRKFRNKVNNEQIFKAIFKNKDGKNQWHIICSSMDWITVTVDGLPYIKLRHANGLGYNHLEALCLMQYIIAVDILKDALIQLYRVIEGNKKPAYPLEKDKEIFQQTQISDDDYFKHLRAVFGTHQVNLTSLDGINEHKGERFYASWTTKDFLSEDDFLVYLYSNDPNKEELYPLSIKIDDVNRYVEKRYQLLEDLIVKVDEIILRHIKSYKGSTIKHHDNNLEQIKILLFENKVRFGSDYGYFDTLLYLQRLLTIRVDNSEEIVTDYQEYLATFIPEIKMGLEEMETQRFYWKYTHTGYELEKIYYYLSSGNHPLGSEYFHNMIEVGVLPSFLLGSEDFHLKQLYLDALLYRESTKLNKRVSYQDLIKDRKTDN